MEKFSKILLFAGSTLYVIGLLAQNVVLASVGASDLILLQVRGIFLGIWAILILIVFSGLPILSLAPWLFPDSSTGSYSLRARALFCMLAVVTPPTIMCVIDRYALGATGWVTFRDIWLDVLRVTALAIFTVILAIQLWREWSRQPRQLIRIVLIGIFASVAAIAYIDQASSEVITVIPASLGGAQAQYVRLVTKPEIGKALQAAGVKFTPQNSENAGVLLAGGWSKADQNQIVTAPLQLIDESGSDITVVLPLWNGEQRYSYSSSLKLKKEDIVAIISQPTTGRKQIIKPWTFSPTWPPQ